MCINVLDWLEERACKDNERPAFADDNMSLPFGEVCDRAKRAGTFFCGKIAARQSVAFYLEKSVEAVCAMFGAVYAGGFYSFIDVRQPPVRASSVLSVLRPALIVTDAVNRKRLAEAGADVPVFLLDDVFPPCIAEDVLARRRRNAMDGDPLYVNFTSGSTGLPKGVAVSHRSVIDFISVFTEIFGIGKEDVFANQAPFDFDVSVKDIYSCLKTGASVQLIPRPYFSMPVKLMDYLADRAATVLVWAVSAMCFVSIMDGFGYRVPEKVRLVMFSGEVMPVRHLHVWQKFLPHAAYVNLYGPTEITCNCSYYVINRDFKDGDCIPIGKAFPNESVFLLDENDAQVTKPGCDGEICVSGTCVALGYYNDREHTEKSFVRNPLTEPFPERMYRTGDIGRYDAEGNLVYAGRRDFQIKHMGHRIELGEIEAAASAYAGIARVCCLYDGKKERLVLFYQGRCDKAVLIRELRQKLPPFMLPNTLIEVEEMPLNKNGKIDRARLKEMIP